jgi:hypothetical protein
MAVSILYVARSAGLCKWAANVGLGKHIFKIGLADDKAGLKAVIEQGWAGETDWRLIATEEGEGLDEAAILAGVAVKEKPVSPDYYPRLKGAVGVVRVNIAHVQNAMLVSQAMASADQPLTAPPPKPKDVAAYLMRAAKRGAP